MTLVAIDGDEWYPVYTVMDNQSEVGWSYGTAELSEYELRMIETYTRGFKEMQDLIRERLVEVKP